MFDRLFYTVRFHDWLEIEQVTVGPCRDLRKSRSNKLYSHCLEIYNINSPCGSNNYFSFTRSIQYRYVPLTLAHVTWCFSSEIRRLRSHLQDRFAHAQEMTRVQRLRMTRRVYFWLNYQVVFFHYFANLIVF